MFSDEFLDVLVKDGSIVGYGLYIEFEDGNPTRVHTGIGNIVIDNATFLGVGALGHVEPLESESDNKPSRLGLTMNGLPNGYAADVLQAEARGNPATLYVLVFDEDGSLLAHEAAIVGFIVDYNLQIGDRTASINVQVADEFELFERARNWFWTDISHLQQQDGDHICRYVVQNENRTLNWGSENDAPQYRDS